MAERIQYVHVHFHQAVTSPKYPRAQSDAKSTFLDAFEGEDMKRTRVLKIEREGDALIATHLGTGWVREYPWSAARQATRADPRCVNDDPRQGLRPVEAKGKGAA